MPNDLTADTPLISGMSSIVILTRNAMGDFETESWSGFAWLSTDVRSRR